MISLDDGVSWISVVSFEEAESNMACCDGGEGAVALSGIMVFSSSDVGGIGRQRPDPKYQNNM